jgi:hypothetical protein
MLPTVCFTLSNLRDRCTHTCSLAEDFREKMTQELAEQDRKSLERYQVELMVSRQDYHDLLLAWRFCRQAGPREKSAALRLEKLAVRIREALDRRGAP